MFTLLSQRLLTVLQFTRMALVFTAISNSLCALFLWAEWNAPASGSARDMLSVWRVLAVAVMSAGLYGFGMSLNDINDRRRDRLIAAHRPIPSGRIGLVAAHLICALLALMSLLAGVYVTRFIGGGAFGFALLVGTGLLITFYDFTGKYLVALGLLTLGLIRFFHATIAAPGLPVLWHPLLLLNHVVVLSTLAYVWEAKRPALTGGHRWVVFGGLTTINLAGAALIGYRRYDRAGRDLLAALALDWWVLLPLAAALGFVALALVIRSRFGPTRRAGQTIMLYGLMWLILYDAAFATAYVSWFAGLVLLALLPMAYISVRIMRWWGQVLSLSQKLEYQRAR